MCKYCERRTDVKLGWDQPELPWHHNQDITKKYIREYDPYG